MDISAQVYSLHNSSSPSLRSHTIQHRHASMNNSNWHPQHHHSPDNIPSSSHLPSMFPAPNRSPDLNYPSPTDSPTYMHHSHSEAFVGSPKPFQLSDPSIQDPGSPFTQIESSIGPNRGLPRRQRAPSYADRHDRGPRRLSLPSSFTRTEDGDLTLRSHPPLYLPSTTETRPDTPPADAESNPLPSRQGLSLNVPADPMNLQGAGYQPMTPNSSSPFSTFTTYPNHSRSNSSHSTNHRVPSPALSAASVLTSVSSSNSGYFDQTSTSYPQPPQNTQRLMGPRTKQKKQQLKPADRKAICLYSEDNPNDKQQDIASRFGVERSTISKILKKKAYWLNISETDTNRASKHRPSKFPAIEEQLRVWLGSCAEKKTFLSDSLIRSKAREIAKRLHVSEEKFKASSGWVENFKHRHQIRGGAWCSDENLTLHANNGSMNGISSTMEGPYAGRSPHMNRAMPSIPQLQLQEQDGSRMPPNPLMMPTSWAGHGTDVSPQSSGSQSDGANEPVMEPLQHHGLLHHQPESGSRHVPLSSHPHLAESDGQSHIAHDASYPAVYAPIVLYHQTLPDNSPPTLADAEEAINRLIMFLDTTGRSLITTGERSALGQIKNALFQAGSGISYERRP